MPFSQIIPPSPCPTESKRLFYTSVSLLLSRIQSYCYHLSKFRIYALVLRSRLSRVQGYPQDGRCRRMKKDRERDKERMTRGDQASVSEACYFIFREGFYTLSCPYSKVKNAKSTQHSISINFYWYKVPSCKRLIFCTLSSGLEACWYFMTSFW